MVDDVYRHNWSRTLVEVERKNEERKDEVQAEINKYRNALKEEYVPKPLSTFHSNENEYINPKDKDRIKRKEKVKLFIIFLLLNSSLFIIFILFVFYSVSFAY